MRAEGHRPELAQVLDGVVAAVVDAELPGDRLVQHRVACRREVRQALEDAGVLAPEGQLAIRALETDRSLPPEQAPGGRHAGVQTEAPFQREDRRQPGPEVFLAAQAPARRRQAAGGGNRNPLAARLRDQLVVDHGRRTPRHVVDIFDRGIEHAVDRDAGLRQRRPAHCAQGRKRKNLLSHALSSPILLCGFRAGCSQPCRRVVRRRCVAGLLALERRGQGLGPVRKERVSRRHGAKRTSPLGGNVWIDGRTAFTVTPARIRRRRV
ncbi:hypothetical protein CBM2608_B100101 [Cupriavidus taiwanensis]|nr:hypothetical protein CBM2608_B100101 [Cupriavidus taiwanensis]